jgi:hypothetical protein
MLLAGIQSFDAATLEELDPRQKHSGMTARQKHSGMTARQEHSGTWKCTWAIAQTLRKLNGLRYGFMERDLYGDPKCTRALNPRHRLTQANAEIHLRLAVALPL